MLGRDAFLQGHQNGKFKLTFVGLLAALRPSNMPDDIAAADSVLSHPVTVYRHQADQSQHWPYDTRRCRRKDEINEKRWQPFKQKLHGILPLCCPVFVGKLEKSSNWPISSTWISVSFVFAPNMLNKIKPQQHCRKYPNDCSWNIISRDGIMLKLAHVMCKLISDTHKVRHIMKRIAQSWKAETKWVQGTGGQSKSKIWWVQQQKQQPQKSKLDNNGINKTKPNQMEVDGSWISLQHAWLMMWESVSYDHLCW